MQSPLEKFRSKYAQTDPDTNGTSHAIAKELNIDADVAYGLLKHIEKQHYFEFSFSKEWIKTIYLEEFTSEYLVCWKEYEMELERRIDGGLATVEDLKYCYEALGLPLFTCHDFILHLIITYTGHVSFTVQDRIHCIQVCQHTIAMYMNTSPNDYYYYDYLKSNHKTMLLTLVALIFLHKTETEFSQPFEEALLNAIAQFPLSPLVYLALSSTNSPNAVQYASQAFNNNVLSISHLLLQMDDSLMSSAIYNILNNFCCSYNLNQLNNLEKLSDTSLTTIQCLFRHKRIGLDDFQFDISDAAIVKHFSHLNYFDQLIKFCPFLFSTIYLSVPIGLLYLNDLKWSTSTGTPICLANSNEIECHYLFLPYLALTGSIELLSFYFNCLSSINDSQLLKDTINSYNHLLNPFLPHKHPFIQICHQSSHTELLLLLLPYYPHIAPLLPNSLKCSQHIIQNAQSIDPSLVLSRALIITYSNSPLAIEQLVQQSYFYDYLKPLIDANKQILLKNATKTTRYLLQGGEWPTCYSLEETKQLLTSLTNKSDMALLLCHLIHYKIEPDFVLNNLKNVLDQPISDKRLLMKDTTWQSYSLHALLQWQGLSKCIEYVHNDISLITEWDNELINLLDGNNIQLTNAILQVGLLDLESSSRYKMRIMEVIHHYPELGIDYMIVWDFGGCYLDQLPMDNPLVHTILLREMIGGMSLKKEYSTHLKHSEHGQHCLMIDQCRTLLKRATISLEDLHCLNSVDENLINALKEKCTEKETIKEPQLEKTERKKMKLEQYKMDWTIDCLF